MNPPRITVLLSGRGSNLAALLNAMDAGTLGGEVTQVVSNRPDAQGLAIARARGIRTDLVRHGDYASRDAFDNALGEVVAQNVPALIVLAGFMRVLGANFLRRFEHRLLNIHPSLLPAYPGLHTHRRALADGVRVHGCTVHFVTLGVDVGPIVAQAAVPVLSGDDETALAARVLGAEHVLLPSAVHWYCTGRLVIDGGLVRVEDETTAPASAMLVVPAIDDRD